MRAGKIQQLSSPDEIYNKPQTKYVAEFIGSPSMNFFEGTISGNMFTTNGVDMALDNYEWVDGAKDGEAFLGVRPEHVFSGEMATGKPFTAEIEIELFEPMGSDTLIYTNLAGIPFHFRLDGQEKVKVGDKMTIGFDVSRSSIFDKSSEARL